MLANVTEIDKLTEKWFVMAPWGIFSLLKSLIQSISRCDKLSLSSQCYASNKLTESLVFGL